MAHALVQVREDLERAAAGLAPEQLAARPGGAASIAFHLRHVAGATGRLLTYARGEELSEQQRAAALAEGDAGPADAQTLLAAVRAAIEAALEQLRSTPRERLLEPRAVGRARLPSSVLGLLFHVAEHAQRHTGQVVATAKAVGALPHTPSRGE